MPAPFDILHILHVKPATTQEVKNFLSRQYLHGEYNIDATYNNLRYKMQKGYVELVNKKWHLTSRGLAKVLKEVRPRWFDDHPDLSDNQKP